MVVLIIIGLVVTVGLLSTAIGGFLANRGQAQGPRLASPVVVTVNGAPIRLLELQTTLSFNQQQIAFLGIPDPEDELRKYYQAFQVLMGRAVIESLASQRGIDLSDAQAMQLEGRRVDNQILQLRVELEVDGDLLLGATNQEFQEAFESAYGITATEFRKRMMELAQNELDDPLTRRNFIFPFLRDAIAGTFALEVTVTEEELRAAYDEFVLDVIPMNDPELSFEERETLADEILEKLEDGADFAALQEQYVDSPVGEPFRYSRRLLEISPDLADLLDLEPGEVAIAIDFGVVRVYKLRAIEPNIPPDFEQNSKPYIDQYKLLQGAELADAAIIDAQGNMVLEWVNKAYEFAYTVYLVREDEDLQDLDARMAKFYEMYQSSLGWEDDPEYDLEPLTYARYYAHTQWYRSLDAEAQTAAAAERAEIVDAMLTYSTSFTLYFALIDLYETVGDVPSTGRALVSAARMLDAYNLAHASFHITMKTRLSALRGADAIGEDDVASASKVLRSFEDDLKVVLAEREADRLEQEAIDRELAELAEPDVAEETDETGTGSEDDGSEDTGADEGG